jgi:DNA-binding PadR family transcriptional regulator
MDSVSLSDPAGTSGREPNDAGGLPSQHLADRANDSNPRELGAGTPPDEEESTSTVNKAVTGSARVSLLGARPATSDFEPTGEELRISARILLFLARQPRYAPGETVPDSLTQAGMARALGTSQASVSNALNRLVDGGVLHVERSHVRQKLQRLKVYQLTPDGERLVRQIRESMGP